MPYGLSDYQTLASQALAPERDAPRWWDSFNFRQWRVSHWTLVAIVLLCCTVDYPRVISIAGVSGLGCMTLLAAAAVWMVWLMRPVLPAGLLGILLPLILFQIDAMGTLFWYRPGTDGVQLAAIGLTFLGLLMVSARETRADARLGAILHWFLIVGSVVPVLSFAYLILSGKIPVDDLNETRGFALYAMTVAAAALADWLAQNRPAMKGAARSQRRPRRGLAGMLTLLPLLWVLIVAYVVLLGMSRTALVAILLLIPLSVALRGDKKSAVLSALVLAIGAGGFALIVENYPPLYSRFFHEDAHLKVGGIAINGTGRTEIWNLVLGDLGDDWMFGKGMSASEDLVRRYYPNVGQPHNDYIRFYYDQGAVGLGIWIIFVLGIGYRVAVNLRRSALNQTADYPMHMAALLALAAVSFSMLTDNSVCYSFVMFPLAILLGSSLGSGAAALAESAGREPL
jgi:O-antigen ligase